MGESKRKRPDPHRDAFDFMKPASGKVSLRVNVSSGLKLAGAQDFVEGF